MFPSLLALLLPLYAVAADSRLPEATGPLRINPENPCWFVRPDGQAVWLTGSHTWANFQERGVEGQTPDFRKANNVNGIDGNPSGDDSGHEVHELEVPEITRLQEAFVRRVIEAVGDRDNVLWEIGNECHSGSVQWQYHMIRCIKQVESTRAQQHPVGMTGAPIGTRDLMASPADWISPPGKQWLTDPPANDGTGVVLVDTDHCDPWNHNPDWVWKNLFRGNQFILMDGYVDFRIGSPAKPDPKWDVTRQAMGRARKLAERIELAGLRPNPELASTGFCLATPVNGGGAFRCAVYLSEGDKATVDLTKVKGSLGVEWVHPSTGRSVVADPVTGGGDREFSVPFGSEAVLYLSRQ